MDKTKEQIKNLIELRKHYYTTFILIISGMVGLFLTEMDSIKILLLVVIGVYFAFIFLSKFLNVNEEIKDKIEEIK